MLHRSAFLTALHESPCCLCFSTCTVQSGPLKTDRRGQTCCQTDHPCMSTPDIKSAGQCICSSTFCRCKPDVKPVPCCGSDEPPRRLHVGCAKLPCPAACPSMQIPQLRGLHVPAGPHEVVGRKITRSRIQKTDDTGRKRLPNISHGFVADTVAVENS